jgi:hypothetical protein
MFVRYRRRSWFGDILARLGAALIILSGSKGKSIHIVEKYGVFIRRV